jgi:hypothetical protein
VLEEVIRRDMVVPAEMRDGAAEIDGFPVHDGADEEIEAEGAEGLALKGAIADFAALVEEYGAFELVRGLALVEPGLATSTQGEAGVPFDHEERPLDATKFAQGFRQLAGVRRSPHAQELFATNDQIMAALFADLDRPIMSHIAVMLTDEGMDQDLAGQLARLLFASSHGIATLSADLGQLEADLALLVQRILAR